MKGDLTTGITDEIGQSLIDGTAVIWCAGPDLPRELLPYFLRHAAESAAIDDMLTTVIDLITARLAMMDEIGLVRWQRSVRLPDLVILLDPGVIDRHVHEVEIIAKSGRVAGVLVVVRETVV